MLVCGIGKDPILLPIARKSMVCKKMWKKRSCEKDFTVDVLEVGKKYRTTSCRNEEKVKIDSYWSESEKDQFESAQRTLESGK